MPLRVLRSGRRAGRLKRRAGARCVGPFSEKGDRDERSVRLSTAGAADRSRAAGLALLVAGVIAAYFLDRYLNMPALVFSHALVILGPTLLKIGYVMRLSALFRLRRPGWGVCWARA